MTCTDSVVHEITHILTTIGNTAPYPLLVGMQADGKWTANIEIDSPTLTDDAEGTGANPNEALRRALTSLRRKLAPA